MKIEESGNFEGAAWDARQVYTREIVYRLHLFLNTTRDNLKEKLETLGDLYECVIGFLKNKKEIKEKLIEIELLLYPAKSTPTIKAGNQLKARELIDSAYSDIFEGIKKADLLIPEKEYTNEVDEFEKLL